MSDRSGDVGRERPSPGRSSDESEANPTGLREDYLNHVPGTSVPEPQDEDREPGGLPPEATRADEQDSPASSEDPSKEPSQSTSGDPHRAGDEEPPPGTSEDGEPDPDVEGPTPDSERERHEG